MGVKVERTEAGERDCSLTFTGSPKLTQLEIAKFYSWVRRGWILDKNFRLSESSYCQPIHLLATKKPRFSSEHHSTTEVLNLLPMSK